ncbi:DUF4330 domain-containing protein [candidate division WS5 bacterium]|uniref:DUF4330 domain-containing protein n=1 Tax=candidate division WS5 bacterium TaxID=2093353 RepID=A0A419DEM0_9BACT|nr:MAG: DUF4330 domain-containing protein [candidate division WS5 bacterium]
MILDKKGRLFGKVNILDFFVLIFLILAAGIICYKVLVNPKSKTPEPMQVTVYADDIQPDVAEEMSKVKEVYFGRGLVKTQIKNVEVLPMPAESRRPDFKEVRITLSGEGFKYDDGAYFGNQRVSLGKKVWLRSEYELEAIVMNVK